MNNKKPDGIESEMEYDIAEKSGGGLRYNEGKAEIHQVPTSMILAVAKTLQ